MDLLESTWNNLILRVTLVFPHNINFKTIENASPLLLTSNIIYWKLLIISLYIFITLFYIFFYCILRKLNTYLNNSLFYSAHKS